MTQHELEAVKRASERALRVCGTGTGLPLYYTGANVFYALAAAHEVAHGREPDAARIGALLVQTLDEIHEASESAIRNRGAPH